MARLTIEQKDERMPVTIQMIGTGITRQPVLTISGSLGEEPGPGITIYVDGPMSEEEVAATKAYMENSAQISTFEGIAVLWEVYCQDVLGKANLPPWNRDVRIYANGDWADDLPEDWLQRVHEINSPVVFCHF